jgi:hypothetical protein
MATQVEVGLGMQVESKWKSQFNTFMKAKGAHGSGGSKYHTAT